MYAKPLTFMVESINNLGSIFYHSYLLPYLTIFFLKFGAVKFWRCCEDLLDYTYRFISICNVVIVCKYIAIVLVKPPVTISAEMPFTLAYGKISEGKCARYLEDKKIISNTPFLFLRPYLIMLKNPLIVVENTQIGYKNTELVTL